MSDGGNVTHVGQLQTFVLTVQMYYTPVLFFLGSLGNCLSIFVFFSTKLRNLSSSYYLSALAVSDTGVLLGLLVAWLSLIDIPLFNQNGSCQLFIYLAQVFSFLSVWFIVAFTVERFIAVRYPLRRPSMCTVARAKAVVIGITFLAMAIYCPYIFMSGLQPHDDIQKTLNNDTLEEEEGEALLCGMVPEYKDLATTMNHVDTVITLLVPFTIIVTLNTLISKTVWRVARVRRSMTKSGHHSLPNKTSNSASTRRTSSSQTKVTEMLLVVSTVFIALNLPSYVIRVWIFIRELSVQDTNEDLDIETVIAIQHAFLILYNTNFGINFVLYCITGQNFRRAMVSIFCRAQARRRQDTTQVTVVSEYCRSASTRRTVAVNGSWKEAHEMMPIAGAANKL